MRRGLRRPFFLCLTVLALALPRLCGAQEEAPPPGRDTPDQAPDRISGEAVPAAQAAAAAAAGPTLVTFEAPRAKFRVDSGYDLDQYLSRNDSPINVMIDLKGIPVEEEARLTLRVYDVDMQGSPPGCGPEVDAVALNGVPLGNLSGADSAWSDPAFAIPPGVLQPEDNELTVEIDSTGTDCWAVQVDWVEVEVPFNLGQVEASAELDLVLTERGGETVGALRAQDENEIEDPVWRTRFDNEGKLVSPVERDRPIAGTIQDGELQYKYRLEPWPSEPAWTPKVEVKWEIEGTEQRSESPANLEGWEGEISVKVPTKVGKYKLKVLLLIKGPDGLEKPDERTHDLYVAWSFIPGNRVPLTHLQLATEWAENQGTPPDILKALTEKEHGNPLGWIYGYNRQQSPTTASAEELIENGRGKYGDCASFAEVWRRLGLSLGLTVGIWTWPTSQPYRAFLTTETLTALDGNAGANARNRATGKVDRWSFDRHTIGRFLPNSQGYDPTFGYIGPGAPEAMRLAYVYCLVDVEGPFPFDVERRCELTAPPPDSVAIINLGVYNPRGWFAVEYGEAPAPPRAQAPAAAAPAPPAAFEGTPIERGEDPDGNSVFERLRVDADVRVEQAGSFGIDAFLLGASGRLIDQGALDPSPRTQTLVAASELAAGSHTLAIYFQGREIRESVEDGPYTVVLRLIAAGGTRLDERTITTRTYSHRDFQGLLADVKAVTDSGVDTDARPGYDLLRVGVDLDVAAAGEITVEGHLFTGETLLGRAVRTARLAAGSRRMELDFPGTAIAASRQNGPYLLNLEVRDAVYASDPVRRDTAAYRHTDFQPPVAFFDGTVRDAGRDADGDGAFDFLDVTAGLGALAPGTYTLRGTLSAGDGFFLGAAKAQASLGGTASEATLAFEGLPVGRRGAAGPYTVQLTLAGPAGRLMTLQHRTAAYAASAFERPGATLGAPLTDRGVDSDNDGLFNTLRVDVPVAVSVAGAYEVRASLLDGQGGHLATATAQSSLAAGARTLSLSFSGPAVRRHRVNGPYRVAGLDVRAGGRVLDGRLGAHTTAAYEWTRLQPAGPELTGVSADRGEDTDGDGLFDRLAVEIEMAVARAGSYSFNARLTGGGEEIGWASGSQSLQPGVRRITLRFDGRLIYGKGIDGPYDVRDLSVVSASQTLSAREAAVTGAYGWNAYERSGVFTGTVSLGGEPLAGATIHAAGVGSDVTDAAGSYRLAVLRSGTYTVHIQADPALAPWEITVDGAPREPGTSVTVPVDVGQTVRVDFESSVACDEIFPIALHRDTLAGAAPGTELKDILNGAVGGQFGWLSWTGEQSNPSLVASLSPPGDVGRFLNPQDPADRHLSRGDWVSGRVGVQSSRGVRDALEALKGKTIVLPVWEETAGRGGGLRYRITGFAQVEVTGWDVAGPNRISAVFRRIVRCTGR